MVSRKGYAPVWLTLGFALGCLFGWLVFRTRAAVPMPDPAGRAPAPRPEVIVTPGHLAAVENLFATWGGYAVWEENLTEIVAWSRQSGRIQAEYYQVLRAHRRFFFRTLQHLTRPVIDHGELVRCPLAFTETEEMRERYYREHPQETPGRYSLDELMERAPTLPPRPPAPAEEEMNPVAGPPGESPPMARPQTTPGDGGG